MKECALAFAQSKPTEWDHFRQEWVAKHEADMVITELERVKTISDTPIEEVFEEPKPHKRAVKQEEY